MQSRWDSRSVSIRLTPRFIQLPYAHVPSALAQQRRGHALSICVHSWLLSDTAYELERSRILRSNLRQCSVLAIQWHETLALTPDLSPRARHSCGRGRGILTAQ